VRAEAEQMRTEAAEVFARAEALEAEARAAASGAPASDPDDDGRTARDPDGEPADSRDGDAAEDEAPKEEASEGDDWSWENDKAEDATPAVRTETRSRYERQSAKLPRIGDGNSVLQSMQGFRKKLQEQAKDDD